MSNEIHVDQSRFGQLQGKVVVLTGGANGIGASIVNLCVEAGAHVIFGDADTTSGQNLVSTLQKTTTNPPTFLPTDVTRYEDNLALFKTALQQHGRVDHAIACAGIVEKGGWFDADLTVETVEQPAPTDVLHVNLAGVLYFSRIAAVYLRHGKREADNKSLTLLSSLAGFLDCPGLYVYQSTKHALLGLLRASRKILHQRDGIRVNAVCPATTDTNMAASFFQQFAQAGVPTNTAAEVAGFVVALAVREDLCGRAVYVSGGKGWEFMEGLEATLPQWLGEEPAEGFRKFKEYASSMPSAIE
ncbi:hypothetical protein MBLNU230_g4602t1 [Neophaeotheca triangularis]